MMSPQQMMNFSDRLAVELLQTARKMGLTPDELVQVLTIVQRLIHATRPETDNQTLDLMMEADATFDAFVKAQAAN